MDGTALRDFVQFPYDKLEEMNLAVKQQRQARVPADTIREERMRWLTDEKRIKAVTV
ncbi:MAG: glutamine synthetase, partial [Thermoleophilia bacterium]|nr:glutamine synthetase [Thermoleophilia bacterium]